MISPAASNRLGWGGIAIVLIALCMRLYYVDMAEVDEPLRADAGQYFRIAQNVVNHGIYSTARPDATAVTPDSYRGPGYPTLIAALIWLFGIERAYLAVLCVQCLLGAATVALSISLALRIMPRWPALTVGVLAAVWPHMISLGGYVLTETTFGFLVALSTFLLVEAVARPRLSTTVAAAVTLAMATLVNPIMLGLTLPLALWFCIVKRNRSAVFFALFALGPSVLWAVRDMQTHAPPRMSAASRLMENVLIGVEPDFIPRYKDNANEPAAVASREWILAELDRFATDPRGVLLDIWIKISSHPGEYLLWYLSKPVKFWTWSIVQGAGDVYQYPMIVAPFDDEALLRPVAAVCHGLNMPLMLAAFAGFIVFVATRRQFAGPQRVAAGFVAVMFVYATGIHSILAPDARYATPFRPFEFVLAVLAVGVANDRIQFLRKSSKGR